MRPDGTVVQVTAVGAVPACVEGVLEECGMAFQVSLEDAGPVVEVIGRTQAGGEMVHIFDFRFRDIASLQDWDAEARDVVALSTPSKPRSCIEVLEVRRKERTSTRTSKATRTKCSSRWRRHSANCSP